MQLPIAFAIDAKMQENILEHVDLLKVGSLEFREISTQRYPIWQIKDELLKNPSGGVVINAANEIAIEKFVSKQIGFMDIPKIVLSAYEKFSYKPNSVDDIFLIDSEVRNYLRKESF